MQELATYTHSDTERDTDTDTDTDAATDRIKDFAGDWAQTAINIELLAGHVRLGARAKKLALVLALSLNGSFSSH